MDRPRLREILNEINKGKERAANNRGLFKYVMTQNERLHIFDKLTNTAKNILYAFPIPKKVSELCSLNYVFHTEPTIEKELLWYFDSIVMFKDIIHKYLKLKKELETSVLINDEDSSLDELDKIDEKVGITYYSILSEMYVNQLYQTADINRDMITDFQNENISTKLLITLEFARYRIDDKISSWQYESLTEIHKKQYDASLKRFVDYVNYKAEPAYSDKIDNLDFILHFDSDLSICDRYDSLKRILVQLMGQDLSEEAKHLIIENAQKMSSVFDDIFWQKVLMFYNQSVTVSTDSRAESYDKTLSFYYLGQWDNLLEYVSQILSQYPTYSELYLSFVKTLIISRRKLSDYLSSTTEIYNILRLIKNVLERKDTYPADKEKLLKKYYSASHFDFAEVLKGIIFYEYRPRIAEQIKLASLFIDGPVKYKLAANLDSIYKNEKIDEIIRTNTYANFTSCQLYINYLINNKNYDDALKILEKYIDDFPDTQAIVFIETWRIRSLINVNLALHQYDKASQIIVDHYFKTGIIYEHLIDDETINTIIFSNNLATLNDITVPIAFHLLNQTQSILYDSLANFLVSHNCLIPSDIFSKIDFFAQDKIIYLLENVCKMEIIESSPFINTIEDLEDQRIKILNFLKALNPAKNKDYNTEILEITKASSIRTGLQQIHESRIYVDTINIAKNMETEMQDFFERYLEFDDTKVIDISTITLSQQTDSQNNNLMFYFSVPIITTHALDISIVSQNEYLNSISTKVPYIRYLYFMDIFITIRDRFVDDEDYGFKSFLSMRIRHGTFSNILRNIFDKHHLISSKNRYIDQYVDVDYWTNFLKDQELNALVQTLLKKFSSDVDDEIDGCLKLINVPSAQHSTGLFDFTYTEQQLRVIYYNDLGKIREYKHFTDIVFNTLFQRLELILIAVRELIIGQFTSRFLALLDTLHRDIDNLGIAKYESGLILDNIVTCKTDIQVTTKQISEWFKISKNQYIEKFPIEMILDTSIKYIDIIYNKALTNAKITTQNDCLLDFKGKYFESFGDIFINIFDNILKSNKDLEENLTIDILITEENNNLTISVKNNLSENAKKDTLHEKIEQVRKTIKNYNSSTPVSYEHGSGYPKICKCIAVGLERVNYSITPILTEDTFEVKIHFNLNKLTV